MENSNSDIMMLVPQVARALGVSPATVRRYIDEGLIVAITVKNGSRRTIRVRRGEVCKFMQDHKSS